MTGILCSRFRIKYAFHDTDFTSNIIIYYISMIRAEMPTKSPLFYTNTQYVMRNGIKYPILIKFENC